MNVERRTSNVEHRIMYSTIYKKDKAKRLPHSTFKLLRLKYSSRIMCAEGFHKALHSPYNSGNPIIELDFTKEPL